MKNMKDLVNYLIVNNLTVSAMESCTGGAVTNAITNIPGASDIIKYSAITYSNEYKIKMGINKKTIDKYTVYSIEVANEMSKTIANYTNSNYGIGVTGRLNRIDKNNIANEEENTNEVYISVYDKNNNKYYNKVIKVNKKNREKNKKIVIRNIINIFNEII